VSVQTRGSSSSYLFAARMDRRRFLRMALGTAGLAAVGATVGFSPAPSRGAAPAAEGGKLEIFSWWTAPGEVEALNALYDLYKQQNPGVEIINAALAGGTGAGGNMKAVLQTRMLAGQPPDSFQVHLGHELIDSHVKAGRMEPIDDIYASLGLNDVFPKGLLDNSSYDGHQWSVPVNIHRSNILWYNTKIFNDNGLTPPATWDDYFAIAEKLKAKGIVMAALGESSPGETGHYFETVLQSVLGADAYKGLWTGATAWTDSRITDALNIMKRILDYANPDYLSVAWGDVAEMVVKGTAATQIDGDWRNGYYKGKQFSDYSWVPVPGTKGIYSALADSFGLPKGAPDRDNAIAWVKLCGTREGQDAFNPLKGSIPARTDAGQSPNYDDYQKQAMQDFKTNTIVPSVVHGFAAKESWVTDYVNAMNAFATNRDVAATQNALVQAAADAGVGS